MRSEPPRMHANIYARLTSISKMLDTLEQQYFRDFQSYKRKFLDKNHVFKPGNMILAENELLKAQGAIRELRRDANRMAAQGGEEVLDWWSKLQ